MQLLYTTKELVNNRDFGTKKIVDVNIAVIGGMLQFLEAELSNLGPSLNPVE